MPDDAPAMPYTVEILPFGPYKRPCRKYPSGRYGEILSEDEIGVWKYVLHLEAGIAPVDPVLTRAFAEYLAGAGEVEKKKAKR